MADANVTSEKTFESSTFVSCLDCSIVKKERCNFYVIAEDVHMVVCQDADFVVCVGCVCVCFLYCFFVGFSSAAKKVSIFLRAFLSVIALAVASIFVMCFFCCLPKDRI